MERGSIGKLKYLISSGKVGSCIGGDNDLTDLQPSTSTC
jgi:hypothetical protein